MLFVLSADKPCTLFCTPVGRDAPVLVADRVMDGTPCGPYESDLCVNGRCQVGPHIASVLHPYAFASHRMASVV